MIRQARLLLVLAVLGTLGDFGAEPCRAQELPPAPLPVIASTPATPPPPATVPAQPPVQINPPIAIVPPPDTYDEDVNGPLLRRDPLLNAPFAPSGLFGALESDIVGVHFKNRLTAPVDFNAMTDTVHVPGAVLDWTGAPRLELGYRFPQGLGEFLVSYRLLATEGTGSIPHFDVGDTDGFLKSRLNMNVIDFDYASYENSLSPCWDMKWKVGVRWASVYYDSRVEGPFLFQAVKNDFLGAGPHLGVDLRGHTPMLVGLEVFARLESAAIIGNIRQRFDESVAVNDVVLISGQTDVRHTQVAPVVNFQAGLSWAPNGSRLRFSGGYELEYWWYLGHAGDSRAELSDQGVFLRAEFHY